MQPATIRRLLVLGVCLAGVGGLYLMPTSTGSLADRQPSVRWDLQTARPSIASVVAVSSPETGTPGAVPSPTKSPPTTTLRAGADRPASHPMATAGQPGKDKNPPAAVGPLNVTRVDAERLTVTWPEATDDVGVVSYKVWLNGFFVLSTQQPRATLHWFNDSTTHVVQVRALDAVGNEGATSPTLLVVRPSPSPAATTSSDPTNTTASTSDPHRSSDAEKEESS